MKKYILTTLTLILSLNSYGQTVFNLNKKVIDKETLNLICDNELKWIRNEIYARHGYKFTNKEIQDYFNGNEWYKPVKDNSSIVLNKIEQENIAIIKKEEEKRKNRTEAIRSFFSKIKSGENKNTFYTKANEETNNLSAIQILAHLDIKNINFCASKGIYQTTIDNGSIIENYFIKIDNNDIWLGYGVQGKSSIIPDRSELDETFYDEDEDEYAIWWEFLIKEDNTIQFTQINAAG